MKKGGLWPPKVLINNVYFCWEISASFLRGERGELEGAALTSRALKKECQFKAAYVVASKKKEVNGKTVSYQEKIPISSYATATYEPQEGGE